MKKTFLFCFFVLLVQVSFAQQEKALKKLGQKPVYVLDSMEISQENFAKFDANRLTIVTIYSAKEAKK